MMKRIRTLPLLFLLTVTPLFAQRADLSGLKFCIDPGHGGHNSNDRHVVPDPGTDFYESESNFQKALLLRTLLEEKGATVILTRYTNDTTGIVGSDDPDGDEPSLSARVQVANSNNVDWFHSIHSNATGLPIGQNTSTNYTLMLVREKIVQGGDPVYGPGTSQPETQGAWDVSLIIGPDIRAMMRTQRSTQYLDWTFYGGASGGYTLGVLRGLQMPGELSEGEFHDYYPETRRLMNNSHRKMEAYAIRNAFMQYFGVPPDSLSIVAGILTEPGTDKPINASHVRLLPEDSVYTGDFYNNGFYMFDGIKQGPHTVRFETPGYVADSVELFIGADTTIFIDRQIETLAAPAVVASTPANDDTAFAASGPVKITFSKAMDTASVRAAFSITPSVAGSLVWSNSNTVLTFKQDSVVLPFNTSYTLRIEGSALSAGGFPLDGNGDGTGGDAFQISFRTVPTDVWPPVIVSASPADNSVIAASNSVINFTFDEPLDPTSVNSTTIVVQEVGAGNRQLTFQYFLVNGQGGINIYPQGGLKPGRTYKVRISGVKDLSGNAIPSSNPIWTFSIAPLDFQSTTIENFSSSVASWYQPSGSGSTVGIDNATFVGDTTVSFSLLPVGTASGKLTYDWNLTSASDWLIREYLSSGPGRSVTFTKTGARLQTYIFGDGSGTLFRFAVDDSIDAFPSGNLVNHEVSLWTPINWVGWRLVEWDLEHDSIGSWIGNGVLEGTLRFDSFQLAYDPGKSAESGAVYFEQLQIVHGAVTSVDHPPGAVPRTFTLYQNYPNPFNPSTNIDYVVAKQGYVELVVFDLLGRRIRTLVAAEQQAGQHHVLWDGTNDRGETVASGVYLYQLRAGSSVMTKRMLLLK
jgi:N-acetylmuramoyl-L-alanine amidase/methionine-rich copper-binding protein CopC